jgi:formylglycine-generating enzyme
MAGSRLKLFSWTLLTAVPVILAFGWREATPPIPAVVATSVNQSAPQEVDSMVRLKGGEFLMGTPRPSPDDQRPVHRVNVAQFWIDMTHVTNDQFSEFVDDTGYRTTAEERGWSLTFNREDGSWHETHGVSWQHPTGKDSSLAGKENYPVVHVSWFDAVAYAAWAKKRLPTEAEYEFAARSGLSDAPYAWGRELAPRNQLLANYWQGKFPLTNLQQDGYLEVSPTKKFPANRYGLYDMAGNVCTWCSDWYAADAYGRHHAASPTGPASGIERVLRGGSWHSTAEKGDGLHVGDRDHARPDETSSRIGFRCARDVVN